MVIPYILTLPSVIECVRWPGLLSVWNGNVHIQCKHSDWHMKIKGLTWIVFVYTYTENSTVTNWSASSVCYHNIVFFLLFWSLIFLLGMRPKDTHAVSSLSTRRVCSDLEGHSTGGSCTRESLSPPHFSSALLCFVHSFYGLLGIFWESECRFEK